MRYGIDVSDCQGKIKWDLVKYSGVHFAILRSTRGSGKPDNYLPTNIKGCLDNDIPFDFYKYSYAMNEKDGASEAKTAIEYLKDYGIRADGKTKLWLDMEYDKQLALGKTKCMAIMKAFKDEVLSCGFGYGLYMGKYAYDNKIDGNLIDDDLWIARYPDTSNRTLTQVPADKYRPTPKGNSHLWGWQYSSKGIVNGINGYVDLNVCYEDLPKKEVAPQYYDSPEWTLIDALNKVGADSTYSSRCKLAKLNNIPNYSGKKEENLLMLSLLIDGKLRKI